MTGAGAIVTRGSAIRDGEVWVGVPARKLKDRIPGQPPKGAGKEHA